MTGLVDCDRFHDVGIFFPALWVDADFAGVLPPGTPVAQCFPVSREAIELELCAVLFGGGRALLSVPARRSKPSPGYYRKTVAARRSDQRGEAVAEGLEVEDEDPDAGGGQSLADGGEC